MSGSMFRRRMLVGCLASAAALSGLLGGAAWGAQPTFVAASGWEVGLAPPTQPGEAGWCVDSTTGASAGSHCLTRVGEGTPVITEDWSGGGSPGQFSSAGYALTAGEVRSVSLNGEGMFATEARPHLPGGLRAVVVEAQGEDISRSFFGPPQFVPYDEHGNPLEGFQRGRPYLPEPEVRYWRAPKQHPLRGVCGIQVRGVSGLIEKGGETLSRMTPVAGLIDRGLLPCADTGYMLGTWPIGVSILLDAPEPAKRAPVAIPGLLSLAGHPGDYTEYAPLHKFLARRHGNAWLLVEGGEGLNERLAVLDHLRATIPHS